MSPESNPSALAAAEDDALRMLRDLIRIDTTNTGVPETTKGEAEAAEYVEAQLREVGYEPVRFTTTGPTRQGVALQIPGRESDRGALLLHGHLDVVPAVAEDWSVPPFSGEEIDGVIWGRGAVDMKDMDAMLLAVVRHWARTEYVPPRDITLILTPDEEAGCIQGAHWIVDNRPQLLRGVTEAVGEVGGYSMTIDHDTRLYLVQTAEKGIAWLNVAARGTAGHGSFMNDDNAVTKLARAIARLGDHEFPVQLTPTTQALVDALGEATGAPVDPTDTESFLRVLGPLARAIGASVMNTANPTGLSAGQKANVIPTHAAATVDGRFLPGQEDSFLETIEELLGDDATSSLIHHDIALETTFDGPTIEAMAAALRAEDPGARAVPYMLTGGTDAKAWSRLGIRCYGFAPLRLPPDMNFPAMFHGVDERVPADAVRFGVRVLDRFLQESA